MNKIREEWSWGFSYRIIEENGKGTIGVSFYPDDPDGKFGFIKDLVVDPFSREEGIGTQLLHEAEEVIKDEGYSWARLAVEKNCEPWLLDWYNKEGYIAKDDYKEFDHENYWDMWKAIVPKVAKQPIDVTCSNEYYSCPDLIAKLISFSKFENILISRDEIMMILKDIER